MQKAAFQALQLQKDAVHNYIRDQVFVWQFRKGYGKTCHQFPTDWATTAPF